MDRQPKVSVIIPVYNAEKYLRQCLDSVINQTLGDIEIICVDDGSTDSSLEILREYEADDSRVHILTQENKHAGVARNNGIDHAHGKYLIFLDSDDFFEKEMLRDVVALAQSGDADVTLFGAWYFDNITGKDQKATWLVKSSLMPAIQPFSAQDNAKHIFQISTPCPWNKLYNAAFVRETGLRFQNLTNTNDMFFVYAAFSEAERICWTEKPYVHYRVNNETSTQAQKGKNPDNFYLAIKALKERIIEKGRYELFKESFLKFAEGNFQWNFETITYKELSQKKREELKKDILGDDSLVAGKSKPDVSIIVPVYNTEKYLEECLNSLVGQTLKNIEIICVNDGSTDGSQEIISAYTAKDKRIRLINKGKNEGLLMARKTGVEAANGRYITFVDSDDCLRPRACEIIAHEMDESRADITQYGVNVCNCTSDPTAIAWLEKALQPTNEKLAANGMLNSFFIKRSNITAIVGKAYQSELCKIVFRHIEDRHCFVGEDIFTFFFLCLYSVSYKGIPDKKIYVYNYGRGVGNAEEMSISKFSKYCDMSKCTQYAREFLSAHIESEHLEAAFHAMGKRMLEGCCRILDKRINEADKQTAAVMLKNGWSEFPFYDSVLTDMLKVDRQRFIEKYIGIPVYNRSAPAFANGAIPKVSVVIPIYNVEPYLEECLDSIVNQTLREIEIICVNDGSTDGSLLLAERYAEQDDRFAIISKHNGGQSSARNCGMAEAHGKYLYFMDSDDMLVPDALQQLYESAETDKLELILFSADSFFETKQFEQEKNNYIEYYHRNNMDGVLSGEELLAGYMTHDDFRASVPLQFYNREFLTNTSIRFFEKIIREDELFSALILTETHRLRVCPKSLYKRRVRGSSTMTTNNILKHFEGLYIVSLNLLVASSHYTASSVEHNFLVMRGKSLYRQANEYYKKLSNDERKLTLANLPAEYSCILATSPFVNAMSAGNQRNPENQDNEAALIRASVSYKVGRFMTWLPRKIRGGIRCYKEHGLSYTWWRVLVHLGLKEDPYK